jgi:hypothetical protein
MFPPRQLKKKKKKKHLLLFGEDRKELSWPLRGESRKMARSLAFSHITRPKRRRRRKYLVCVCVFGGS